MREPIGLMGPSRAEPPTGNSDGPLLLVTGVSKTHFARKLKVISRHM